MRRKLLKRKHCKTCRAFIPLEAWPEHVALHVNQLSLFEQDGGQVNQ